MFYLLDYDVCVALGIFTNIISILTHVVDLLIWTGERLGRAIVTDAITTPVVNTSAYFFKKTADLIDFKVYSIISW